jgi:hypothetical protein
MPREEHLNYMRACVLLGWAINHIEFPMVPDPKDGIYWKGCPGCRVIWTRDMVHGENCMYTLAHEELSKAKNSD